MANPEKQNVEYRVRLDEANEPISLKALRQQRKKQKLGRPTLQRFRGRKAVETQYAQNLIAKKETERGERAEEKERKPDFILRFEKTMARLEQAETEMENEILAYTETLGSFSETIDADEYLDEAIITLSSLSPTETMASRPLTFLSQPLPIASHRQWNEIELLTEAAQPFYTYQPHMEGPYGMLVDASVSRDAEIFSEAILEWVKKEQFKPKTVIKFIRALARIRNADCLYYERMYFSGDTDPNSFIPNLAALYEKTTKNLRPHLTQNKTIANIANSLGEEALVLRIIQAQRFGFIAHDRPVDFQNVLVPTTIATIQEIKENLAQGITVDPRGYARRIINTFRSRRCSLTNEEIFAICLFFSGRGSSKKPKDPYHQIPWMILDQIRRGVPESERYQEFQQKAPTYRTRLPAICRALSKINLAPKTTTWLVPDLLLEARKMGYLKDINYGFYKGLGVTREVWNQHQRELEKKKSSFQISQGDIVIFVPLSGWCLTEAHLRLASASREIGQTIVKLLEIKTGKPIKERGAKVVLSFGMYAPKAARGMPSVEARSQLAKKALGHYEDVYVSSPGEIDEKQERSARIEQLMALYSEKFGITWSRPNDKDYPGEGCVPVIAGATEKLGKKTSSRPTSYISQPDKPTENIAFLNSTAQIFALLKEDISPPSRMGKLISGLLEGFKEQGITPLITQFPEVHSTLAAQFVKDWLELEKKGNGHKAKRLRLAFRSIIPPAIVDEAWEMMKERVRLEMAREEKSNETARRVRVSQTTPDYSRFSL